MLKSVLKPIGHILKFLIKTALFLLSLLFTLMLIIGFFSNKTMPAEFTVFGILGICYICYTFNAWANKPEVCPVCKSGTIELDSIKEIDRWLGKTKVRERMASGKTRERYVQCAKVKKRYTYCCQNPNCKHTYTKIREEEL